MRCVMFLITMIFLSGCAGLTLGKYPYPKGVAVASENRSMAEIETVDLHILQQIEGYAPDIGLIGVVVPVIPFGQWEWLTGISIDDLRISVYLWLTPKTKVAEIDAGSLKVEVNGVTHRPSEIRMGGHCGIINLTEPVDPTKPLSVPEKLCLLYSFADLRPPDTSFYVSARGLPTVEYVLERKLRFGFLSQ